MRGVLPASGALGIGAIAVGIGVGIALDCGMRCDPLVFALARSLGGCRPLRLLVSAALVTGWQRWLRPRWQQQIGVR